MPLGLLVPLFLAGFAALLVPLVLHLRRRDRRKPRPFPSLMFLARVPVTTDSRRRITDWPLLLLRALVLSLLVMAFARPYMRGGELDTPDATGMTVLLLDRSASMSAGGIDQAWADSAAAVIDRLPDRRRVAVVAFDVNAEILSQPTDDHALAKAAVNGAPAAAGATRFGAGLRAASQLLAHEPVPGQIVLVTDMQRNGLAATTAPTLPPGTGVEVVMLQPNTRDNSTVIAIEVEPLPAPAGRRAVIGARINRQGGEQAREVVATLEVDGRELATLPVTLGGEGTTRVTFDTVAISRAEARVTVRIEADDFPVDDSRQVVVPADVATRLTLLVPRDVRNEEVRYLESALSIGRDPSYTVDRVTRLDRATISNSAAILLFDVPPPEGEVGAALSEWLGAGGGLVVLAGERLAAQRSNATLFAASLTGSADRSDGAVLGDIEVSHPALAEFRNADVDAFASVRIRRHALAEPAANGTVLVRYDDGTPAVVAAAVGGGRSILVAIPLDNRRGDFPLQPAFLPFLRGVTGWASGHHDRKATQESGEPWLTPVSLRNPIVRSPTGDISRPASGGRHIVLREVGVHELFEGRAEGVPHSLVAANSPVSESDLSAASPEDLLIGVGEASPISTLGVEELAEVQEARQKGWRWLLLAAMLVLGVELIVASRGWRGVARQGASGSDNGGASS